MSPDLREKTVTNIAYSAIGKGVSVVASVATSIVLARYLSARDFGIYGFAVIFITFLAQFSDFGLSAAVVQRKDLSRESLTVAFTIRFLLGVVLCALAFVLAPFVSIVFESHEVVRVVQVLGITFLTGALSFLPQTQLTRGARFDLLSASQSISSIVNAAVAIALAVAGKGYWSIVVAIVASAMASAVFVNAVHWERPRFHLKGDDLSELISFGGKVFLSGLVMFSIFSFDNAVVGAIGGAQALGYYSLAFSWGSILSGLLQGVVLNVLFPMLSSIQNDRRTIRKIYLELLEYAAFFAVLLHICLFWGANEFLRVVLGHGSDKWAPALGTFRIMCLYGIISTILVPVGPVIVAIGKADVQLKAIASASLIQTLLLYPVFRFWGIEGVAVLVTASYGTQFLIYLPAIGAEIDVRIVEFVQAVARPIIAGFVVISLALVLSDIVPSRMNWATLVVKVSLCGVSFIILHGLIGKWRLEKGVIALIMTAAQRRTVR